MDVIGKITGAIVLALALTLASISFLSSHSKKGVQAGRPNIIVADDWCVKVSTKDRRGDPVEIHLFLHPLSDGGYVLNVVTQDDIDAVKLSMRIKEEACRGK